LEVPDAALLGEQGWDLLAHALDIGDADAVCAAGDLFDDALARDPDHPDGVCWIYGRGLAAAATAEVSGSLADWDRARTQLARAWAGPAHPNLNPEGVAADLAMVLLARFRAADAADVDELVGELDALAGAGRVATPAVEIARGLSRVWRFRGRGGAEDCETGLALLASALQQAADDTPMLVEALVEYSEVAGLTGAEQPALAALARARSLLDPGQPWPELDDLEGELTYLRWCGTSRDADLDAALRCYERLCATPDAAPTHHLRCGELLLERGRDTRSVPDLDRAVRRLVAATGTAQGDEAAEAWVYLAMAHSLLWELSACGPDREQMVIAAGEAVRRGAPTVDLGFDLRRMRVEGLLDAVQNAPSAGVVQEAVEALDEATTALAADRDGDAAARAELALVLVRIELGLFDHAPNAFDLDRARTHLDTARLHPDPHEEWPTLLAVADAPLQTYDDLMNHGSGDFGVAHLAEAMRGTGRPDELGEGISQALGLTAAIAASRTGDIGSLHAAVELLDDDRTGPSGQFMAAFAELGLLSRRGAPAGRQLAALDRLIDAARAGAAAEPAGGWTADYLLPMVLALRGTVTPAGTPVPGRPASRLRGPLAEILGDLADVATATATIAAAEGDPHRQRAELLDLARRVEALPVDSPQRGMAAHLSATWWARRAERTRHPEDIAYAVRWSEEASDFDGGPENPLWVASALRSAEANRLRDSAESRQRSREYGLAALRGHAWMVLLQSGTEHAVAMARSAAADAVRVARWCLHDRATDDLVSALDAGRGLVLHAAVTTRDVAERLRAAGAGELAQEWINSGGSDPIELRGTGGADLHGDLRRRVLSALADTAGLLEPPSTPQIRAALRAHDSDALVYLVPASEAGPGLAVVVPATEPVEVLELPDLRVDIGVLPGYADAYAAWHQPPEQASPAERRAAFDTWRARLGELTTWAWRVAGLELAELGERLRGDASRAPHLLLVPFGMLALVPWHAARPGDGSPGLAHRAVLSTTPSARLLCQALARPVHAEAGALIVGNPSGGLKAAGAEARALVGAFYPDAVYLGRPDRGGSPAGPGTVGEVVDRLGPRAQPLYLLHLACHARAEPSAPGRSSMRLADRWLDVDELLAVRPTEPLDLDTAVLAACSTNVSGDDYDEAFSLATAFLAAGARTAFGSMWTVPDRYTSRLMFMVHHYREVEGCPPAVALHQARLWAMDPDRVAPLSMPPALAASWPDALPSDDPVAWAGCLHVGA
jgi:hypothetical protein